MIGDLDERTTRKKTVNILNYMSYLSTFEPRTVKEALNDEFWTKAMQEELEQFDRNQVWTLVPRPSELNVIGTKWIFKNKTNEYGIIIRNKARLVA